MISNTRPLGTLSDFVMGEFPAALEHPSMDFVEYCNYLIGKITDEMVSALSPAERDLARLDLKMIAHGVTLADLPEGETGWAETHPYPMLLPELLDTLSDGEAPSLLYEEIVLVNPSHDLRLFTKGEVGETERTFYVGHRQVEERLAEAIQKASGTIKILHQHGNSVAARELLGGIEDDLQPVISIMGMLHNQDPKHFACFRHYLKGPPYAGGQHPGPSGAYTAAIPILELLLRGKEHTPGKYLTYFQEKGRYFPRAGRRQLAELVGPNTSGNLLSLWQQCGTDPDLKERIDVIGKFFDNFRKVHYRAVHRQIPEAIFGDETGTGGEQAGDFLRERMVTMKYNEVRI